MKKVGLLTIHKAYNYGAVLQTYATMKTLNGLGFSAEIIDFTTSNNRNENKFLLFPNSIRNIKHNIRNIKNPIKFYKKTRRYESFFKNNYSTTVNKYSYANYKEIPNEDFDYIITGSDQTFALNLGGNSKEREVFFLPFETKSKKISYSSSMGEKTKALNDESKGFMKKSLLDYKNISVRERNSADFIESLIGERPKVTFDPTLAVAREEWDKIAKPVDIKGEYIFFYTVLSEPWVIDYVKAISQKYGLPIVALHSQNLFELGCNFIRKDDCGPGEFLTLLKNAEYVVTTSFHGTAFSMIYEKRFLSLVLGEGNRIKSLFEQFGSDENLVTEDDLQIKDFPVPDSEKITEFMNFVKETNESYLKSAIT